MGFSVDLRERAVAAVDDGISVMEAAETFRVSIKSIYNWLNLRKQTGSLVPKMGYQKGHSHKIKDWEKFRWFAEKNREYSSLQMATRWNELTGSDVSDDVILKGLRKIGYTSKKKRLSTQNQTKKNVIFIWKKSKI
jgi:transposase